MIPVTSLRPGKTYEENGDIFEVLTYNNMHLRKTSSVVQVKVRSFRKGSTVEKTYPSNGEVSPTTIEKRVLQFLYKDQDTCFFMDPQSYEQISVPIRNLRGINFLKDGENVTISFCKNIALSMQLPPKVKLKVTDTNPGVKGNSAGSVMKDATLENGLVTKVPLFIEVGDVIIVDTRDSSYTARA
jgi:elongation factor P